MSASGAGDPGSFLGRVPFKTLTEEVARPCLALGIDRKCNDWLIPASIMVFCFSDSALDKTTAEIRPATRTHITCTLRMSSIVMLVKNNKVRG